MKNIFAIIIIILITIIINSCSNIVTKTMMSTQTSKSDFDEIAYSDPRIDSFKNKPDLSDSLIKFTLIDSVAFNKLLSKRLEKFDNLMIYFWGLAYPDSILDFENLTKIKNNVNKDQLILLSFDLSSNTQIQLLKHYLNQKGMSGEIFIVKTKDNSVLDAINDMKTFSSFYKVHNNLKLKETDKLTLPSLYIIDKDKNVIYKTRNFKNNKEFDIFFNK